MKLTNYSWDEPFRFKAESVFVDASMPKGRASLEIQGLDIESLMGEFLSMDEDVIIALIETLQNGLSEKIKDR